MEIMAQRIALEALPTEKYEHTKRVVELVGDDPVLDRVLSYRFPDNKARVMRDLQDVAWLHDVLEDTDFPNIFPGDISKAVRLLTHNKEAESYDAYLVKIKRMMINSSYEGFLAYHVKMADIKDHLKQKETLTPKLKEKYLSGLAVFL